MKKLGERQLATDEIWRIMFEEFSLTRQTTVEYLHDLKLAGKITEAGIGWRVTDRKAARKT